MSKHPSLWRGEQGLGHEADWWARLGKSQRKAPETKARVDVGALQKQASWQAAHRGSPGSHIQAKMLHPSDSSDCGHPNVRSSASSFEMPFFLNKGQKGTPSRLPEGSPALLCLSTLPPTLPTSSSLLLESSGWSTSECWQPCSSLKHCLPGLNNLFQMYCQFKAALCLLKCLQQTTVEKCWDFPTLCCLFHQYDPPSKLPLSSLQSHGERRQSGDFCLPLSLSSRTMLQGLVGQFTPVSLAPRKLMQEDQKFEASLGYIMSSGSALAMYKDFQ